MPTVNIDVKNQKEVAIVGALVSVFDGSNALQDSGLTDANGRFTTTLSAAQYRIMATKDGIAAGNSQLVTVT